jgi:hypothetical protein
VIADGVTDVHDRVRPMRAETLAMHQTRTPGGLVRMKWPAVRGVNHHRNRGGARRDPRRARQPFARGVCTMS